MADTLQTKKVTDLTENTAMSDEDLFMVGSAGTASLRKLKWSNILNTIKTAILGKLVANNLTTTEEGYLLDARQGKALDDKISKLNTDINKAGSLILLASSSEAKWVGKAVTKSISNFKSICFILKDSNNSISSQTEIPVDVYKTCNSGSKTVCIIKRSDVESYSYYSNDNTIGLYVSASGYTVEAYGRY